MKALWYIMIFFHELFGKRKLRPFIAYATDPQYRKDVRRLRAHIGFGGTTVESYVPFNLLRPAHKVHYWDWMFKLANRIKRGERIDRDNPLTVSQQANGTYLVIDGNHRYYAMVESKKYDPTTMVKVIKYRKKS